MAPHSLDGRRILVAGARGGIGSATVALLREREAAVAEVDRDLNIDITEEHGPQAAIDRARHELGGLDGVVHAIGMSGRSLGDGPPSTCTDDAWDAVLRVNLTSAFRLVRAALPYLGPGSSIVLVGSVLATATDADFLTAAYTASKGGLRSLVRAAAREGAPRQIRVNLVSPGLVDTPMASRAVHHDPAVTARLAALQPLGGRALDPIEVAEGIVWLLSPASRAATGIDLVLDRGWSL